MLEAAQNGFVLCFRRLVSAQIAASILKCARAFLLRISLARILISHFNRQRGQWGSFPPKGAEINHPFRSTSVKEGESLFASRQWRRTPAIRARCKCTGRLVTSCSGPGEGLGLLHLDTGLGQKARRPSWLS